MGPSEASAHGGVHEKRKDLQHVLKTQKQIKHTDASGITKTIDVVPETGLTMCFQQARTTVPTIGTEVGPDSGTKEAWTLAALCPEVSLWLPRQQLEPLVGSSVGLKRARFCCRTLARKEARKESRKDGPSFLPSQMANQLQSQSRATGPSKKRKDLQRVLKTQEQIKHTYLTETEHNWKEPPSELR